jgi:hypothetical protein
MTTLSLEVGTSYITNRFNTSLKNTIDIVRILGTVDLTSYEYRLGGRFFGSNAVIYTESGEDYLVGAAKRKGFPTDMMVACQERSLTRPIRHDDRMGIVRDIFWKDVSQVKSTDRYITVDHPNFAMKIGSVYLNRMGFGLCILSKTYVISEEDVFFFYGPLASSEKVGLGFSYTNFGKRFTNTDSPEVSMYDLQYMRV